MDERGAFLALLRLGGNGAAGADGGVGTAPAASGRAQLLAQRLYSCISSVIVGEADPRCLIAALEEFLLLDEVSCLPAPTIGLAAAAAMTTAVRAQAATVRHALHALRIVMLVLPDLHTAMLQEVSEQLVGRLPGSVSAALGIGAGTRDLELSIDQAEVLQKEMAVMPRLLSTFCQRGAVSSPTPRRRLPRPRSA